jgi:hypothetical protein
VAQFITVICPDFTPQAALLGTSMVWSVVEAVPASRFTVITELRVEVRAMLDKR